MNLIEVENVTKSFQDGLFQQRTVLNNINLTVREGDFVVLRGANGAGKSTLLKIILGLQSPDKGRIQLFGKSPTSPASKLQVGTVFQEVVPPNSLKVHELIQLVRSYYPDAIPTQEILEVVGLTEKRDAFPSDLAGGQKQRLYFALALVGNPKLLILDEPTKNLDIEGQEAFWYQVQQCREKGVTILMVTHIQSDQDKLQTLATHIITLADGTLTYDKKPTQALKTQFQTPVPNSFSGANFLNILVVQSWIEILQLLRNPLYLAGVLLFSCVAAILPLTDNPDILKQGIISLGAISLLIFSVERLGKRVAIERVEGWLKLLRVTPLPPIIYIIAKLIMTALVLLFSLFTIFGIGIFKFGIEGSIIKWLTLSSALLLITLPFAVFGIALGYIVQPKALDSITGLLIPIGALLSGLVPIEDPAWFQYVVTISPFFHYKGLVQAIAGNRDNYLQLHLIWLTFYTIVAGWVARVAYQRDRISI